MEVEHETQAALSLRILLGLGLGVLAGLALQNAPEFAAAWIQPFGTLFLNLVKMLVVPLVFCSLTAGVGGLGDARHMGRVGGRTLLFYLCTTALAVALACWRPTCFRWGGSWVIRSPPPGRRPPLSLWRTPC